VVEAREPLIWRKARRCGNTACIEVAKAEQEMLLRDSKDPAGPRLVFAPQDWTAFLSAVREDRI
jgi:Domain of unknown function (DUF397)